MRLYDTARGEVVPFEVGEIVTMYTCGITPYDATHVGHAATYLTYDVLQRRLRDLGHVTRCVRNITDVDDDLLRKARELDVHYLDLAAAETARFAGELTRYKEEETRLAKLSAEKQRLEEKQRAARRQADEGVAVKPRWFEPLTDFKPDVQPAYRCVRACACVCVWVWVKPQTNPRNP